MAGVSLSAPKIIAKSEPLKSMTMKIKTTKPWTRISVSSAAAGRRSVAAVVVMAAPDKLSEKIATVTTIPKPNPQSQTTTIRCGPRDNRGPLVKGRILSVEAIQAVQAIKRAHHSDPETAPTVISRTLSRLIKSDLLAVLKELLRQDRCALALQVFSVVRSEFRPELSLYADVVKSLKHYKLGSRDRFLILSSDGLYQYFTNQQAVSEVDLFMASFPAGDPAQHLAEEKLEWIFTSCLIFHKASDGVTEIYINENGLSGMQKFTLTHEGMEVVRIETCLKDLISYPAKKFSQSQCISNKKCLGQQLNVKSSCCQGKLESQKNMLIMDFKNLSING